MDLFHCERHDEFLLPIKTGLQSVVYMLTVELLYVAVISVSKAYNNLSCLSTALTTTWRIFDASSSNCSTSCTRWLN